MRLFIIFVFLFLSCSCDVLLGTLCDTDADCPAGQVCNGSGACVGTGDGQNPYGPLEDRWVEARAQRYERCSLDPHSYAFWAEVQGAPYDKARDMAEFRAAVRQTFELWTTNAFIDVDPTGLEACVGEAEAQIAAPCDDDWVQLSDCDALSARVQEGQVCWYNECATGYCGWEDGFDPDGSCPRCVEKRTEGQDCTHVQCEEDLQCNDVRVCVRRGQEGEDCANRDCEDGLYCAFPDEVCTRRAGLDEDCSVHRCQFDFECSPEAVCREPLTNKGLGEICSRGEYDACGHLYSNGLGCAHDEADDQWRCQPRYIVELGEDCSGGLAICRFGFTSDRRCIRNTETGEETCVAEAASGQECGDGRGCADDDDFCNHDLETPICEVYVPPGPHPDPPMCMVGT